MTAGYGFNRHPTPGSLFAMGWSRLMAKEFIRFFKSAKKKNMLLMASFLFYFLCHPSSIVSNTITFFIPPALSAGRTSFRVPLPSRPRVFGWLLRVFASFIGRLRPRRIFFSYFFSINSMAEPTPRHSPARSAQAAPLLHRPLHRFRHAPYGSYVRCSPHHGGRNDKLNLYY